MAGFWKRLFVKEPEAPAEPAKSEDEVRLDMVRSALAGAQSQRNLLNGMLARLQKEIQAKDLEFKRLADEIEGYPEDDPDCEMQRTLVMAQLKANKASRNELKARVDGYASQLSDNERFMQQLKHAVETLEGTCAPGQALDPQALALVVFEIGRKAEDWKRNLGEFGAAAAGLNPSVSMMENADDEAEVKADLARRAAKKKSSATPASEPAAKSEPATSEEKKPATASTAAKPLF